MELERDTVRIELSFRSRMTCGLVFLLFSLFCSLFSGFSLLLDWLMRDRLISFFAAANDFLLLRVRMMRWCGLLPSFFVCFGFVFGQELVAHRGASADAPENTLAAFKLAWEQGADAIEGDFYLSADDEIVCIHDKDTERTAPEQPVLKISESTLDQLKQLDVGAWKDGRFKGERIPTIEEVFAVVPEGKKILIEIKCGPEIVPHLKARLAASSLEDDQVLIICFNAEVVRAVREAMPHYKVNWLTSYRQVPNTNLWFPDADYVVKQLNESKATGLGTQGRTQVVNAAFCEEVTRAGFELHVWTVNDPKDAAYFSNLKFDSITTDRPRFIRESLSKDDSPTTSLQSKPAYRLEREVVQNGYDGKRCWVHARAGVVRHPNDQSVSRLVLTSQLLDVKGSDTFSAISSSASEDMGESWSGLRAQEGFARWKVGQDMEETICDFTPTWHAASGCLLGTGQSVRYRDGKVMKVRPRYTAYSIYDPTADSWCPPKRLEMPDATRFSNCGAGSVQRFDEPDGTILLPVYFKSPEASDYSVTVCRCSFDGTEMRYLSHGDELTVSGGRGLYEPSVTKVNGRFFLTLRNDHTGYVCSSEDGLHYTKPIPWLFDNGESLGNYNTQQHWVDHAGKLYLVYTRRGAGNDHVFRNRAPLFMGEVDPMTLRVRRSTEQVIVPERGARLGNFGVLKIDDSTTWVVVSEWMQTWRQASVVMPVDNPYGSDNSIYIAKIKWNVP